MTLEEKIEKFNEYCSSQPSCPCKFNNEHCELKWLEENEKKTQKRKLTSIIRFGIIRT
jgi:hypothetical protein